MGGEGVWERVIPEEEHLFVGLRRDFEGCGDVVQIMGFNGRSIWWGRPGFFSASQPYQEYTE